MSGRAVWGLRTFALALLLVNARAPLAAADQTFQVHFEYAAKSGSILLPVRINEKSAVFILDTGFPHTVIQPELLGPGASAPSQSQTTTFGMGLTGDGADREVTVELGGRKWEKRRVAVKDLSQAFSTYQEKISGVLGLDILREFSRVSIDIKEKTLTLVGSADPEPSLGRLGRFTFAGHDGHYTLNGAELPRILSDKVYLKSLDGAFKISVTFGDTIQVANGKPLEEGQNAMLQTWAQRVPLVAKLLKNQDPMGSFTLLLYDLIEPTGVQTLQIREEIVFLRSTDPEDDRFIGVPILRLPIPLPGRIVDVQYRGLEKAGPFFSKIALQLVYIRSESGHSLLGGFVIVSKASGEYEFYLVPQSLLDQIVIGSK